MRRQIVAVAAVATVAVLGLTATATAQPASRPPRAGVTAIAAQPHSPAKKTGPHMWDPSLNHGKGGLNPNPSTVTVTQTTDLVNQQVQVSWTNFTPSTAQVYNPQNVAYPVMVTECKGTDPASPADCYGAENGGVTSTSGA